VVDAERLGRIITLIRDDVRQIRTRSQSHDPDDDVVRANVALLDDLDAFTAALAGWVTRDS
jgi:hypothetical protein